MIRRTLVSAISVAAVIGSCAAAFAADDASKTAPAAGTPAAGTEAPAATATKKCPRHSHKKCCKKAAKTTTK